VTLYVDPTNLEQLTDDINSGKSGGDEGTEGKVTLAGDITTSTLTIPDKISTLDLAGHKLTLSDTLALTSGLTITGSGTIEVTDDTTAIKVNNGTLTLESGTIVNQGIAISVAKGATVKLVGGKLEADTPLSGNGTVTVEDTTTTTFTTEPTKLPEGYYAEAVTGGYKFA
jgi:hypothetical protein